MCPHRRASGRRPRPRQAAHQRGVDQIFSFCDVDTEPDSRRPAWRAFKNKAPTSILDSDDLVAAHVVSVVAAPHGCRSKWRGRRQSGSGGRRGRPPRSWRPKRARRSAWRWPGSGGPGALERAPSCRASAWLDLRSGYSAALHKMRESKRNFTSATYFGTASSYF